MIDRKRVIILIVLVLIVLPVSATVFFGSKTLAPNPTANQKLISNSFVLDEALPPNPYDYIMTRISRYHETGDNKNIKFYTIKDDSIERREGKYVFYLQPSNGAEAIEVSVAIQNYGNFFGITVMIDGKVQAIS